MTAPPLPVVTLLEMPDNTTWSAAFLTTPVTVSWTRLPDGTLVAVATSPRRATGAPLVVSSVNRRRPLYLPAALAGRKHDAVSVLPAATPLIPGT